MTSTTDARPTTAVPSPRPVPDDERIPSPEPDWAAGYPLLRYAADHLRILGKRIVNC